MSSGEFGSYKVMFTGCSCICAPQWPLSVLRGLYLVLEFNQGQPQARQVPYPLYYFSDPAVLVFLIDKTSAFMLIQG